MPGFTPVIFTLYEAWANVPPDGRNAARAAVLRGEILFNSKPITISGVNGLNLLPSDPLGANPLVGTCGTCHDSPNVGNHSVSAPLNIGVADPTSSLNVSYLPVIKLRNKTDSTQVISTTDPGRALVTGKWADIGKFKTPSLRNVALTAPYMHDGSVATLEQAVDLELYARGGALNYPIALTADERRDIVEFLKALTGTIGGR